ncbi:retrovirus-related Pol polyprotein from transposon RE1 isoform X1 [Beta vulgaris subsp. vulgaris]|uniref:retrovirus-related Pol polyprotein from transposon RE1 isoform X1 n=1 Tax=Beta vulgaris subsp. vulgaris TaxID=3555 RepID=UPI00254835D4|nr:retrovirus-related Pol polyprotein from transposon RE1 isoform X1 [Beta vulgaris subsp. vulgaris]XP_057252284.1 retrovirus-related Pol polyprotein from transposon RE1 isoform X1 [Beta vulgaris subsp. vulgaris]XP_057252285.1 retrovirus-related Pol polyprotein from transposon RE1 isoform X1 [Beta vulgaris subsp. vulgaris]XP_057252286.1 retrovirus-related Pol polyprotein from transposon RE1 isoform X1 [Beta vulgaris subsp. vulgaris]XP_057252287.1 retrovirus-related Pol polyprotein from transpos
MKSHFSLEFCIIHNNKNQELVGVRKVMKGLYYLIDEPVIDILQNIRGRLLTEGDSSTCHALNATQLDVPASIDQGRKTSDTFLWHMRLGHAPLRMISQIDSLKGFIKYECDTCVVCPLAKFTRLSFPISVSRASAAFEMIHIDTWGPYRVNSKNHQRFFLTVVDDHTRMTWIHPMRNKSDAYDALATFVQMAKTQFDKRVKVVRSDNAVELDDKHYKHMFDKLGIVHQTSCVDTPEQNGRVERRHRNLLEMARALKLQAGVPAQLRGDCVLAAAHITNRLPTTVLENVSPYKVLYETKPNYNLLKTFGCFVIAYNPDKSGYKLNVRGVPCIFLGYPTSQKGYRVYNLLNNTTFVTRHTKFYEHLFPYQVFKQSAKPIVHCRNQTTREWYDTEIAANPHTQTLSDPQEAEGERSNDQTDQDDSEIVPDTSIQPTIETRKSSRTHKPPSWLSDYKTNLAYTEARKRAEKTMNIPTSKQFWCFAARIAKHSDNIHY